MKNFYFILLLNCLSLISCSTSDSAPDPVDPEEVVEDAYNYIVLRHDGQMFEIGDNTGQIKKINKIPNVEMISVGNTVTGSAAKIYFYEHKFPPQQPLIHEYTFATKTSTFHVIEFPEVDFGPFAGLESLEWDENKKLLVGIVRENFGEDRPKPARLAQIDPETFLVSSLDIEVPKKYIISALKKGNQIYASSYRSHSSGYESEFFKIDLQNGSINNLIVDGMTIAPIHLSHNENKNILFGFLPVQGSSFLGASKPVVIDPATGVVKQLLPNELTGNLNQFGRSFFNIGNKEHVDLITSPTYLAIFRYNSETQKVTLTKLPHPNDLGTANNIVGVVKL